MRKTLAVLLCLMMFLCAFPAMAEDAGSEPFVAVPTVEFTGDIGALRWAEYLEDGDVVGQTTVDDLQYYSKYLDLFDDFVFVNENTEEGDISYYVYDPTAHGLDPNQAYPVSIWFHGGGNWQQGKAGGVICSGAAGFACNEYQQEVGGMYVIAPVSSPKGWSYGTVSAIKGMLDTVKASHRTTDELIVCGTSAGGLMVNRWLEEYAYMTDVVFWMSTTVPSVRTVQKYSDMGIKMWFEVALHDGAYNNSFPNGPKEYDGIENFAYTVFEWVRCGNGMIATCGPNDSINGQHCSFIQTIRNFIQNDGTPDDPNHPDGVTGFFRDALAEIRAAE